MVEENTLSIAIVTYRNKFAVLQDVIDSVLLTTLNIKLYIIDNSPTNELKNLIPQDSRLEYIFMNSNNGFGAGHNVIL